MLSVCFLDSQIVSEYDQKILQSQTAGQPCGTARETFYRRKDV